jgi:Holliday junction resolvase RusA-like endonuclease
VITLTFPFPITENHYLGRVGHRSFLTKKAKDYILQVQKAVSYATIGRTLKGPLRVMRYAYFPDERKRDLENLGKVLMDACTRSKLWEDDNRFVIVELGWKSMGKDKFNPRVVMEITEVDYEG